MPWFFLPPLLWLLDWIWSLRREWSLNEQYAYGWFVPALTAYLLWSRWQDRPHPQPTAKYWSMAVFALCCLTRLPLGTILGANPDWRLALWSQTTLTFVALLAWLTRMGGKAWLQHFSPAFTLLFLAVPWPSGLENTLVNTLMHSIAAATVSCMNWAGTFAEQHGNLIRLTSGWVGVEEACSGVRSLQSTLMAAIFLGELFRWSFPRRAGLLVLGALLSVALNFGRTLTLTTVSVSRGPEAMGVVHDPIGHAVSIGAFAGLFGFAWWLNRRLPSPSERIPAEHPRPPATQERYWTWATAVALALSFIGNWLWYLRPEGTARVEDVSIDWSSEPRAQFREISPTVRAILRYSVQKPAGQAMGGLLGLFSFFTGSPGASLPLPESTDQTFACLLPDFS